ARLHADGLLPQAHVLRTVHQLAPERALRLVTDQHDVTLRPPQVVLQVVQDAPAVAHAAAGDHDGAGADVVDAHRVGGRAGRLDVRQERLFVGRIEELRRVQAPVLGVHARRAY